jgi:Pyridoxamine 5'-phosphate oxidase
MNALPASGRRPAMATTTRQEEGNARTRTQEGIPEVGRATAHRRGSSLTTEQVWRALEKRSFAVVGYATPSGEPRSSGVVYKTVGRRLFVVVAADSWKAKHIAASRRVAVTVPVRRGGALSLVVAIPPATVSFHGTATVYPPGSPQLSSLPKELMALLPAERRIGGSVVEIVPEGTFVTYGLDVPLMKMADPDAARGRVAVGRGGKTR